MTRTKFNQNKSEQWTPFEAYQSVPVISRKSTLYVFGAGSSKDWGSPLGNEFFSKAKSISDGDGKNTTSRHVKEAYTNVINILATSGIDYNNVNFEELLTTCDIILAEKPDDKNIGTLRFNLIKMIFGVLTKCFGEATLGTGDSKFIEENPVNFRNFYQLFIKNIIETENPIFINLNYDILLDSAVLEAYEPPIYERISTKRYIRYLLPQMKKPGYFDINKTTINPSGHKMYKPHGTVNLLLCNKCNKFIYSKDSFITIIDNNRDSAVCPFCNEKLSYDNLSIIPPNYNKNIQKQNYVKELIEDISLADEINIIGYSFPPYDQDFRNIFLKGLCRNKKLCSINIIDKDEDEAKVFLKYNFLQLSGQKINLKSINGFLCFLQQEVKNGK
ncbi:MAG: hypothetical protein PHV30_05305 [Candidatus Margulisbacteria bacterium]|nr:hypothetical protein [Candidatus Margulisiibacteriota bacterium]